VLRDGKSRVVFRVRVVFRLRVDELRRTLHQLFTRLAFVTGTTAAAAAHIRRDDFAAARGRR
jgi:hypothetical protein